MLPSWDVRGADAQAADLAADDFDAFARVAHDRLRRALVAQYGVDIGCDLADEAMAYAWEHWSRVSAMENPVGYLYRVARSASRRHRRWRRQPAFPAEAHEETLSACDDELALALSRLSPRQRACVVLTHVFGWRHSDAASVLGLSVGSVRNYVHRGMKSLRHDLEEP